MRKENSNDEVFTLSDMIDEYEEDSELRRKIEAMKQAQAENESKMSVHQESAKADNEVKEALPVSNEDDAVYPHEAQTDAYTDHAGNDKTRVVMEHPRFDEEAAADDNDSVYMYDNHEVVEEEITEADIDEFLGEDKKRESKPSVDPEKMNKTITIVIIVIVSVCLLIGIGFGVKAMLDGFGSDDPITDTDKDKNEKDKDDDKPITEEPNENEETEGNGNSGDAASTDKTKQIAEIKGKIDANKKQIDEYNKQINEAQNTLQNNAVDENELADKRTKRDETTRLIGIIAQDLEKFKTQCSNPEDDSEFCAAFDAAAKTEEMNTLNQQLTTLNKEVGELEKKKQEYDKANSRITELNSEVTRLNNENNSLQEELSSLQ